MPENLHTEAELTIFANEMLEFVVKHKNELLRRIEEFHVPRCTAKESMKEGCLLAFSMNFLDLLTQMAADKELEEYNKNVRRN